MWEVTVVMCAFNAETTVAESIESVLNQSFFDFEFIFVNDGSTDSTLQIAIGYAERDSRIKIINQKNTGVGVGRNNAIAQAVGKYVAFLDSDDVWSRNKLDCQLLVTRNFSDADIVIADSTPYESCRIDDLSVEFENYEIQDFFDRLVDRNLFFQPQTALVRTECFKLASFTDDYSGQDYYPFLVFATRNLKIIKIDASLYGERSLAGSLQRSSKSSFVSGAARFKAVNIVLNDPINKNFLSEKRIIKLKKASDRFLAWSIFGSRTYLNYFESLNYAITKYGSFNNKLCYFTEVAKSIIFPVKYFFKRLNLKISS